MYFPRNANTSTTTAARGRNVCTAGIRSDQSFWMNTFDVFEGLESGSSVFD